MPGAAGDPAVSLACAHAWVDHLRSGGTTPWLEWVAAESPHSVPEAAEESRPAIPGAVQLELLRQLNVAGEVRADLADHVLRRPAPGRGGPSPSLLWPKADRGGGDRRGDRRGGAPVDPTQVPAEQLLRVAAGVLTDLALELPPAAAPTGRTARRRRAGRVPSFRVEGSPVAAATLRAGLAAVGAYGHEPMPPTLVQRVRRRLGGTSAPDQPEVVLVVGAPVDRMLFEVWSRRTQLGASRQYGRFVTEWQRRADLPPATQLAHVMRHWAGRIGAENVHLLTCDHGHGVDPQAVQAILGVRPVESAAFGAPADLPGVVVDVLRRHNAVLALRVPEQERAFHVERLRDLIRDLPVATGAGRLGVPEANREWVRSTGIRLGELLDRAGYPVHGDTEALARVATDLPGLPGPRRVLPVMVQVILRVDAEVRSTRGRQEESA